MGNHFEQQNFQPKSLKTCLQYLVLVAVPPLSWRKNLVVFFFSVSRYLIVHIYYMYASMRMLSCAIPRSSGTFQHLCPKGGFVDNVPQRLDAVLLLQYVTRGPRSKPHVLDRSRVQFCIDLLPEPSSPNFRGR